MKGRGRKWGGIWVALALTLTLFAATTTEADTGPLHIALAGVKPGMSRHQILRILGKPRSISTWFEPHGRALEREWHYPFRLTVSFEIGFGGHVRRVDRVRTYSPRDRLPNGIHVGVREAALHHKLHGIACGVYSGSPGTPFPSGYLCTWFPIKANSPCGPNLQFYMHRQHGRVIYMDLAQESFEGCA